MNASNKKVFYVKIGAVLFPERVYTGKKNYFVNQ